MINPMALLKSLSIDLQFALEVLEPFYDLLTSNVKQEVDRLWADQEQRGLCTNKEKNMQSEEEGAAPVGEYPALPEPYLRTYAFGDVVKHFSVAQMRAFADATVALRAQRRKEAGDA